MCVTVSVLDVSFGFAHRPKVRSRWNSVYVNSGVVADVSFSLGKEAKGSS